MRDISRGREYFDALYRDNADPWNFTASRYETAKYDETCAVLAGRRYASGLEIGCSIGVLSARIAPLCERFLGLDISDLPLAEARARCALIPTARFERAAVPGEWPAGQFDLILLSEVLYFMSAADIEGTAARVRSALLPAGQVLLVNWLGAREEPQPGAIAAARFIAALGLPRTETCTRELYRIDLLTMPGG